MKETKYISLGNWSISNSALWWEHKVHGRSNIHSSHYVGVMIWCRLCHIGFFFIKIIFCRCVSRVVDSNGLEVSVSTFKLIEIIYWIVRKYFYNGAYSFSNSISNRIVIKTLVSQIRETLELSIESRIALVPQQTPTLLMWTKGLITRFSPRNSIINLLHHFFL